MKVKYGTPGVSRVPLWGIPVLGRRWRDDLACLSLSLPLQRCP